MDATLPPNARPLLPLLYIVWEDGYLGPRELEALARVITASGVPLDQVRAWVDTATPPSPKALAGLASTVRSSVDADCPRSLVCVSAFK